MRYYSTRNKEIYVSASQAILKGIADDGGLFVPEAFPQLPKLEELVGKGYRELAFGILKKYLDDYSEEEILQAVEGAYDDKFEDKDVVPIKKAGGAFFLELFKGPTLAFKDMALTILPYLLKTAAIKQGVSKEVVILTATSGDTGKAALEGFKDVPGTRVVVFYPENGVSKIQRLQMVTQRGSNTYVAAVKGNFDDAQNGVKEIFNDKVFNDELNEKGFILSSANSINIGRLLPQIVYYVYGYLSLAEQGEIRLGDKINIVVPTGNFGNILAAYYAMRMGLPVNKLLCASNDNRVLTDFFESSIYDRRRKLILTSSPSMDILISSNLERYLFHMSEANAEEIEEKMKLLQERGYYQWSKDSLGPVVPGMAGEQEISSAIEKLWSGDGYLMDPHTAIAYSVWERYLEDSGDNTPALIASTASPFKFSGKVLASIGEDDHEDEFKGMKKLGEMMGIPVPERMSELEKLPILHRKVCEKSRMRDAVKSFLEGSKING